MKVLTKVSIAVVCALGVTAAIAQTVQPRTQGATQARPPVQIAQTVFPAGGASTGGSVSTVTGVTAGTAAAGTAAFVTFGVVAVGAAASDSGGGGTTVTHTP